MDLSVRSLKAAFKRRQNWPYIVMFLVIFSVFFYYFLESDFMDHTKRRAEQNNIASVMKLKASSGSHSRNNDTEQNNIASVMELKASSGSHSRNNDTEQNNIAFVMELTGSSGSHSRFIYRFKQCLASICQRSSINLTIHIFANSVGKDESLKALDEIATYCIISYRVKFYDVTEVIKNILPSINVIKDAIAVNGSHNKRKALYYLPIFMDRLLPEDVTRVILLDADFFFYADIKQLFDHFDNFKDTTIFGLAYVQLPTYRAGFKKYRESHPGAKIGDPPPDGVAGYNGGLSMLHLSNMRKSKHFRQILLNNEMKQYGTKYQFRGTRAEQDFFVLLDAEHHDELFYVVPCQWNRQLCVSFKQYDDYDKYRNCPKPIFAYHGNCGAKMPTIDDPYPFGAEESQAESLKKAVTKIH